MHERKATGGKEGGGGIRRRIYEELRDIINMDEMRASTLR
jgi:hypothetical protein